MGRIPAQTIDESTVRADVEYIESLWQRRAVGAVDMPVIDVGGGEPLVCVPILEHLEFVYARQVRTLSATRRVILYRRSETRSRPVGLAERVGELRHVLDSLALHQPVDFVAHGDAAMVLLEFAARFPQRCRSLVIVAQGADYQISPHPLIWLLHELYTRLPVEALLPSSYLRRTVINYILASKPAAAKGQCIASHDGDQLPPNGERRTEPMAFQRLSGTRLARASLDAQFRKITLWPSVYKYSVLPVIHSFDMRERLKALTMPVLLLNRADDALSPEYKTRWLAANLPDCRGYYVIPAGERFFIYSEAETLNQLMLDFLQSIESAYI